MNRKLRQWIYTDIERQEKCGQNITKTLKTGLETWRDFNSYEREVLKEQILESIWYCQIIF